MNLLSDPGVSTQLTLEGTGRLCAAAVKFGYCLDFLRRLSLQPPVPESTPWCLTKEALEELVRLSEDLETVPSNLRSRELDIELLLRASRRLDLSVPRIFLERLDDHDLCEIYDANSGRQIWRNLEFLEHLSCDLPRLVSVPFPKLFERDIDVTTEIQDRIAQILSEGPACVPWNVDQHWLIENQSEHSRIFRITPRYIGALRSNGTNTIRAWMSTFRVQALGDVYDP